MKNKNFAIACLCAAVLISGCAGGEADAPAQLNVIDAGGHSASMTDAASGETPAPQTTTTLPPDSFGGNNAALEQPAEITEPPEINVLPEPTEPRQTESVSCHTISADEPSSEPPASESVPAEETPEQTQSATTPAATTPAATTPAATTPAVTTPAATTPAATTEATSAQPIELPQPSFGSSNYRTLNYSEVKGVWISYIELADMLTGKSESGFRTAIGAAYDNCVSLGLNTVYVHARSHGDAYYESELFPWSKYVTGTYGMACSFDPLEIMIEEAHSRGLSFQAWINPLRAASVSEMTGTSGFPVQQWANDSAAKGSLIVAVNGTYYLNPAYDEVIDYIANGAAEIVSRYDVDGLHIDDYFYPTTDASFDSSAFSESGYSTLSAFRFANCDKLVGSLYAAVKGANPSALFGVSCQGSMENNYNLMYADVKKWCTNAGYVDYIMPQIYYGFDNSAQPYETCTAEWNALAKSGGIPLIVGLSASKIGLEDTWAGAGKNEWINNSDILSRQLISALGQSSYGGVCLYSYRSVFTPDSAVSAQAEKEIAAFKAALNG